MRRRVSERVCTAKAPKTPNYLSLSLGSAGFGEASGCDPNPF
jgi:hypothetical protein